MNEIPLDEVCASCGETYGCHCGIKCGNGTTTFVAVKDAELAQLRAALTALKEEEAKWLPQWQGLANDLAAVTQERDELSKEASEKYCQMMRAEEERDELKADAVRLNIHLEQKDKALKVNAEAYKDLEQDRAMLAHHLASADQHAKDLADLGYNQTKAAEAIIDHLRAEKLLILQQVTEYDNLIRGALQLPPETEWRVEFYAQEIRRLVETNARQKSHIEDEDAWKEGRVWLYKEDFDKRLATERARGRELFKKVAVEFFYWWHNQTGSNTEQGFDEWWARHKELPVTGSPLRTYEQGAVDMRERAAKEAHRIARLAAKGEIWIMEDIPDVIRALPTQGGAKDE